MLRVGRRGGRTLIKAARWESIKIGRSQRLSVASTRHVAARSAALGALTRGHPATRRLGNTRQVEETGDVLRHHPLWTTADVAAFLMCESTAARQLLQIAARRVAGLAPI
jgi:hypothetical protein